VIDEDGLEKQELKSDMGCGCGRVSDGLEDEDSTRTASVAVTSVSQRSTSCLSAVTPSTEHFLEATCATLDSRTRVSRARAPSGSRNTGAEALRSISSGNVSSSSKGVVPRTNFLRRGGSFHRATDGSSLAGA
jgi:hypothetical protein